MKTQLIKLSRIAGWISFALGTIHTGVTIVMVKQTQVLVPEWRSTFLFMYVAAGVGCLLAGSIMLLSVNKEIRDYKSSLTIYMIPSLYMLLLGIGAPIAMSSNPFGYISLAVGVFAVAVGILRYSRQENLE